MMMTLLIKLVSSLVIMLVVALSVGFYTLMERKTLAYIQLRKGPNKVGFMALPQPLVDALKLFSKENISVSSSNKPLYMISPITSMLIMFTLWNLYLIVLKFSMFKLSLLFFLAVSSLNVYPILLSGWASNSKYSLIGAIRAAAQTISYEVSMALTILPILMLTKTFNIQEISANQPMFPLALIISPVLVMWFISSLAETNRAPFDLAEGESELVSGFNIEYGSGEFAFLFIAEYGSILLMSMVTACLFSQENYYNTAPMMVIKLLLISYLFLWVRGSYPRMRYDSLMQLTWKTFLSVILMYICFIIPISNM